MGEDNGVLFLAMPYLEGESLDSYLRQSGEGAAKSAPCPSVFQHLLPYLDQQVMLDDIYTQGGLGIRAIHTLKVVQCPSDPTVGDGLANFGSSPTPNNQYATGSYGSNPAAFGTNFGGGAKIPASFPDGTSNTILYLEKPAQCGSTYNGWAYGYLDTHTSTVYSGTLPPGVVFTTGSAPCASAAPHSYHSDVMVVGVADGSVRSISKTLNLPYSGSSAVPAGATGLYTALTPAGREVLPPEW